MGGDGDEQEGTGQRDPQAALRLGGDGLGEALPDEHDDQQDDPKGRDAHIDHVQDVIQIIPAVGVADAEQLRHAVDEHMADDRGQERIVLDREIAEEDAAHERQQELPQVLMPHAEEERAHEDAEALTDAREVLEDEAAHQQLLRHRRDQDGIDHREDRTLDLGERLEVGLVWLDADGAEHVREEVGGVAHRALDRDDDADIGGRMPDGEAPDGAPSGDKPDGEKPEGNPPSDMPSGEKPEGNPPSGEKPDNNN